MTGDQYRGGYTGKLLDVDLGREKAEAMPWPGEWAETYLGGKGFGARILYDQLPKNCDPLSPQNILLFLAGPLTGTLAPATGRTVLCTKSPATGLWLDANCGGFLGPELKMAGFDGLILRGRARQPVVVVIDDEDVRFRPSPDLWGLDTFSTHRWVKENLGGDFRVAAIGEAGEKGVLFAGVISEYRAFGRGGAGAVMGSKNLKAVAVRGSQAVPIARPERFMRGVREAFNELAIHPDTGGGRQKYGTNVILSTMNRTGIHPVKNFQKGSFQGASRLNEEEIEKLYVRHKACYGCPIHCSKITRIPDGKYAGSVVEGPEYENVWAFGAQCENADIGAIVRAEYLCDYYGLDGISTGNVIGFLMECVERGALSRGDLPFELRFGDDEAMIRAIHVIGRREGPGYLLGEGVERLARKITGAQDHAIHVKGMEMPAYDPRASTGMALAYATSDRGACHLRAWPVQDELLSPEQRLDPFSKEMKAELVKTQQDFNTVLNACGNCMFSAFALSLRQICQLLGDATGMDVFSSPDPVLRGGERINNLVRLFNLREGLTRERDRLPGRFSSQPLEEGPARGRVVDLDPLLDEYYLVRGWDRDGIPENNKLKELNLVRSE